MGFNPRARVGRDNYGGDMVRATIQFQSTRPRGARQERESYHGPIVAVSIHAPAWGATNSRSAYFAPSAKFQSTRPRGARRVRTSKVRRLRTFQSTRPRGARPPGS